MRAGPAYPTTSRPDHAGGNFEAEALLKLSAVRSVVDAILGGHWLGSTGLLDSTVELVEAASRDLRYARLSRRPALGALRGGE